MTGFDEMKGLQSDIFIYRYICRCSPIYSCLRQVRDIVTGFDEMKGLQSATYQQKIEVFFKYIYIYIYIYIYPHVHTLSFMCPHAHTTIYVSSHYYLIQELERKYKTATN